MNKLFYNGEKYIEIPANWSELEKWQIAALISHLHNGDSMAMHKITTLLILAATKHHIKHQGIIGGLTSEDRYDVANYMTWWCYDKPIYFTHNPFQKFKGYYGPGKDFKYLYFEEFIKAEPFYSAYAKDQDPAALDGLISCLYRPKRQPKIDRVNPFNREDGRVIFSSSVQDFMLEKVKDWDKGMKLAIFYYYDSCLQLLVKTFPWAFTPGDKIAPKLRNDSEKTLYHVARELAKGIELEKVLQRPIVPVFFELNEARIDAEKMKIEIAKNKKS